MLAILGEDKSDVETLNVLARRIANKPNMSIKLKGYNGCPDMLGNGARQIRAYSKLGCNKFIICYDSDGKNILERHQRIIKDVIKPSGVAGEFCTLVPVQELESWILSDLNAITKIITGWKPPKEISTPENIPNPKEYLEKICRTQQAKPLYIHTIHNQKVAKFLDLRKLIAKCPSSIPLFEMLSLGKSFPLTEKQQEIKERKEKILDVLKKNI